jgi:hypothetical protein
MTTETEPEYPSLDRFISPQSRADVITAWVWRTRRCPSPCSKSCSPTPGRSTA